MISGCAMMNSSDWREELPAKVRILQIIVGALFFGCFCFLVIAFLISQNSNKENGQVLTIMATVYGGVVFLLWLIVPGIVVSNGRKKIQQSLPFSANPASEKSFDNKIEKENLQALGLMGLYQTKTIIACALLEGAIFFLQISYIIDHSMFSLLMAITLMILLIAHIPITGRVSNWIERQLRLLEEERQLA
jgi:hypothetical protein